MSFWHLWVTINDCSAMSLWDYSIMNSSDDCQLHSSVGFKVHRSKALSKVSVEQQRIKFQPSLISKKQAKVGPCCSDDHCGREPQRGEKSFCIKAGFVSRIVARFFPVPNWKTTLFGTEVCRPVCFGCIYGHDRYTALLTLKSQGVDVSAELEELTHHN